jgi:hypothetical protein
MCVMAAIRAAMWSSASTGEVKRRVGGGEVEGETGADDGGVGRSDVGKG